MVRTSVFKIHRTYESTPSLKIVMQEYTGHRRSLLRSCGIYCTFSFVIACTLKFGALLDNEK